MQTCVGNFITQFAIFPVDRNIAIRNYLIMALDGSPAAIARAPRPWLTRRPGECAFPVDGAEAKTRSCCNPCGQATYCDAHRTLMRGPRAPSADDMLRDLARIIG